MDEIEHPQASRRGLPASGTLCSEISAALDLSGASITVFGLDSQQSTVCATDRIALRADALQIELGEGPRWQAQHTGKAVIVPDLASGVHKAWPMFTLEARDIGIAAAFAFPMYMGTVVVGAVDLYSFSTKFLTQAQISLGLSMASRAASAAVHRATDSANEHDSTEHTMAPALRREVHQATGMIQAQLDATATEAFARLRSHAFSTGRSIDDVARDVVGRTLDFSALLD